MKFKLTDSKYFDFNSLKSEQLVKLPIKAMEFIWCATYFCISLKLEIEKGAITGSNKKLKEAYNLLNWAKINIQSKELIEWPSYLPQPVDVKGKNIFQLVNEIFYLSLAWILLHEIYHLKNDIEKEIKLEEIDADLFASSWILDKVKDSKLLLVRKLGVLISNTCIVLLHKEKCDTHPVPIKRLMDNLYYGSEGVYDEYVITIILPLLKFHIETELERKIPSIFDLPSDALYEYYKIIYNSMVIDKC